MKPQSNQSTQGFSNNQPYHPAYLTPTSSLPRKSTLATPRPSNAFLEKLNAHLLEHLSDEKLDVRRLTRLIGMSRSDLHRKVVKNVGMSTTAYIRLFRLNYAAQMLVNNPGWSIYQVALEAGFSNQSYFSKRFKEIHGAGPLKWRKGQQELVHKY